MVRLGNVSPANMVHEYWAPENRQQKPRESAHFRSETPVRLHRPTTHHLQRSRPKSQTNTQLLLSTPKKLIFVHFIANGTYLNTYRHVRTVMKIHETIERKLPNERHSLKILVWVN